MPGENSDSLQREDNGEVKEKRRQTLPRDETGFATIPVTELDNLLDAKVFYDSDKYRENDIIFLYINDILIII